MAEKQSNRDRLKEITDSIEKGIQELFQSEKYRQYLRTMSRFHKYSVNNTMLIYMQKPDATVVAGFNKWRDQFGRNVLKGEKGIKIIAPTPYKKKIEEAKLDPDTKLPMLDADGKAIMEEKEIKIPMYKPVTVFDVSQTEGKPLPQLAADLTGNVQNYEVFMEAVKRSAPVPVFLENMTGMDGYYDDENQRIAVRTGMIDGIINNGPRKTVAELEEQSRNGTPISLLELAQAVQRENEEKRRAQQPVRREKSSEKPSILARLKALPVADTKSVKSAPKRSAEREL